MDFETGCWNWIRATHGGGYGGFSYGGTVLAHRASYVIHKGPIGKMLVMHTCDNKKCVNPEHLILGTKSQNNKDAYVRGLNVPLRGSEAGNSKLKEEDVLEIRRLYKNPYGYKALAEKYGISSSNLHAILTRHTWRHI